MPVDIARLRTDGVYESREPVAGLAADLSQIQSMAAGWRQARTRLALWDSVAWVVGIICFAVGFLWYLGIALFALGGWFLYLRKSYPKAVANHAERCAFGRSMASMLWADADPNAPAAIRVAFNPKEETLSEGALPNRKNGKERLYKLSWFSVEARLSDGTTFSETVEDFVRQRSFTNPRGKSKTKTRTQSMIAMRFDYPPEIYGDLTPVREKMEKEIQLPAGATLRGLEVTPRAVKVKALLTDSEDPGSARVMGTASYLAQASTMLALGVYRLLNLSREIEARKRAQGKKGDAQ